MKLMPWRDRSQLATLSADWDNWMADWFNTPTNKLPEVFRRAPMPPVNLAETPKEFIATIEIPGLEEKDIQVQLLGDQLVISGERKWEEEKKDKEYYRVESQYGSFRRVIEVPDGLNMDADAIRANYSKGVLEVRMAKFQPKPAVKIRVSGVN